MSSPRLTPQEKEKRDLLLLDLIRSRYDSELQRINSIDNKAGSLIGFVSVVVGLLIGLAGFQLIDKLRIPEYWWIYFAGITSLLCSVVFSLVAIKIRKWDFVPEVRHLWDTYTEDPYRRVIRRNSSTMVDAVEAMEKSNDSKARWVDRSWYFLVGGLILVLLFLVIIAATDGVKPAL